jgi:peptide/nickel transport system substrate-binding protein
LQAKIGAEGVTNWFELFRLKDIGPWEADVKMDTPVLNPWVLEINESARIVAVRNPYYYAVDTAGNQLPYFDRIVGVSVPEGSSALLMGMSGEVDISGGGFNDLPLMLENEKDVYTVYRWNDNGSRAFYLNLTKEDPVWQQVVGDIRFRQAVNFAIDRQEIVDDAYGGTGMVTQAYPAEYDPDQANALLDEMGLTARDGDGYRLGPDGQPFVIEVNLGPWQEYADPLPLITAYLKDVGIKVDYKQIDANLMWEQMAANQVEGRYDWDRANTWRVRHNHDYLPNDNWGPAWVDWYNSGGEQGIEPPDWVKELYSIHEEIMRVVPGTPEDQAAMDSLYAWYAEYLPIFIIIDGPVYPAMVNNRIGNVPTSGWGHSTPKVWRVFYDKNAP